MTSHDLRRINDDLHELGEAHRLGLIERDEYRRRRRVLVGMLEPAGDVAVDDEKAPRYEPEGSTSVFSGIPAKPGGVAYLLIILLGLLAVILARTLFR